MTVEPRVSALVVTYQHERYIREAITSALSQTVPPHEVIVVDDGSSDDTVAHAREIADPRVRVIANEHRGLSALATTYNSGLAQCRDELIALLEGDDRWPRDKLERQLQAFRDPDVVLSHGVYSVIDAEGALLHAGVPLPLMPPLGAYDARPFVLRASYILPLTAVVRRSAILGTGGFHQLPGTAHCDYPTFLALSRVGRFHFTNEVVGEWRRHTGAGTYRLMESTGAAAAASLALAMVAEEGDPSLPRPDEIRRAWADAEARRVWQNARVLLVDRRFSEARRLLAPALLRRASAGLRARLFGAAIAAWLHLDVEWAVGFFGGARLRPGS